MSVWMRRSTPPRMCAPWGRGGRLDPLRPQDGLYRERFPESRFIDDKGSVAILLTLLRWMRDTGKRPRCNLEITFTVYEELGHGGATFSPYLTELLAVDMGCVGADLNCDEYHVSICAADSSGPFDYEMVTRLSKLARENGIPAVLDVYPHYSSDVAVAWKAGLDAPAALIGPGVQASHGMERTHLGPCWGPWPW